MKKRALSVVLLFVFAFAASFFGLQLALWGLSDRFSEKNIHSNLAFSPKRNTKIVDYPKEIFTQPYYYLTKGSQSYVFVSEDNRFVIKFFRHNRYRTPLLPSLPAFLEEIQQNKAKKKQNELQVHLQSCKLAFEELQEECGLIYMHLNKSDHLKTILLVHDALKRPYTLDLDQLEFFVQKRGEPLLNSLERGDVYHAMQAISKLLSRRLAKGIDDHDPVLQKNTGFSGNTPLFLDIGSFYRNDRLKDASLHYQLVFDMTRKLKRYVSKKDQEAIDEAVKILL